MTTLKNVIENNKNKATLINAVINRIGVNSVQDVMNSGADAGFSGFIYYSDTHRFAMRHRKSIAAWVNESADEFGVDVIQMVGNFGVFRNKPMDNTDRQDLYNYLGNGKCEQSTITNTMAWFALEEVCRLFDNDY